MRFVRRLIASAVAVLLLAAPAAFACGELGAMTSRCPMVEMAAMAEAHGAMGGTDCHGGREMSEDCCDIQSAPEPMQARSGESIAPAATLDLAAMPRIAPPALVVQPRVASASAVDLHGLGRYTLFSSFLL